MKSIRFVLIAILACTTLTFCRSNQKDETSFSEPELVNEDGTLVRVTDAYINEGCNWLLEMEEKEETVLLLPISFGDEFKINGQRLRVKFHFSKINQSNCQLGRPIVVDGIKLVVQY